MTMTLSAMTMGRATWTVSTDMENEQTAIWIRLMGMTAREEPQLKRGSQGSIIRFSLEARLGEATEDTYVESRIHERWQS